MPVKASLSIHDPGSLRQQYRGLQDCYTTDSESGIGHHSFGNTGRKSGRREIAAPQRPRRSVHLAEYFNLIQEYGITPSMSRKGNCYDNAMAENFFSILKTECIYRQKIATFRQARELIDEFIHFYNHERIQLKTGVAPPARRHSA